MAKVMNFREKWTPEAVAKYRAKGEYAKYPSGNVAQITGYEQKWKNNTEDWVYSKTQRVAGPRAVLQAGVTSGVLPQNTLADVWSAMSANDPGFQQEVAARKALLASNKTQAKFTLQQVPQLLAAANNKDNWVTEKKVRAAKKKSGAAGARKGNIVPLGAKLRKLAPGKIINVTGIKATGAGARTIDKTAKMRLKHVAGLEIASSDARAYNVALGLLVSEGFLTQQQADMYALNFGNGAAAAAGFASAASSPGGMMSAPVIGGLRSPGGSP